MFTGIVQGIGRVTFAKPEGRLVRYGVQLPEPQSAGLQLGASVAVDGVCQTVVAIEGDEVHFDAIEETLDRTTLSDLSPGRKVNIERSLCFGDEVGGHLVSGHVFMKAPIRRKDQDRGHCVIAVEMGVSNGKYLFEKGFVAIDGASLTVVEVNQAEGLFSVHVIPETLERTTLGWKEVGDWVNLEWESHTQAVVDTVERYLERRSLNLF